jgi:hypothetical protein
MHVSEEFSASVAQKDGMLLCNPLLEQKKATF